MKNEMKEKIVEELFSMEDLSISKYWKASRNKSILFQIQLFYFRWCWIIAERIRKFTIYISFIV